MELSNTWPAMLSGLAHVEIKVVKKLYWDKILVQLQNYIVYISVANWERSSHYLLEQPKHMQSSRCTLSKY